MKLPWSIPNARRLSETMDIMDDSWLFLLQVALIYVIYLIYTITRSSQFVLPEGPSVWQFIGSMLDMSALHLKLTDMAKEFGEIFGLNLLGYNIVVLNRPTMIRRAFTAEEYRDVFAGRPKTFLSTYTLLSRSTAYMSPGRKLLKRRKLLHKAIKMYGSGVKEQDIAVRNELSHVIQTLSNDNEPHALEGVFLSSLMNIMSIMLLGKRFGYDDRFHLETVEMLKWGNKMAAVDCDLILGKFPFLRYVPFGYGKYYQNYMKVLPGYINRLYEEQKATFNPKRLRGLVDVLLKHQLESTAEDDRSWLDDEDIKAILNDTIGAVLTSRGALLSFFLVILHKPEIAKRVQVEIKQVVGTHRPPLLTDRQDMPYTEACILETLRFISHAPVIPRTTTEDVFFEGYHLPRNTLVLANFWAMHHDETLWENPWEYKPERFLDNNGKLVPPEHPNKRNLMPFGIGRRVCPAEGFAKSRIFLYITSLLQKFDFKVASPQEDLPPLDPRHLVLALVLTPLPYRVRVVQR